MRILVYKRTHNGDPDANGYFGSSDCMGAVRSLHFDAVIGVGGIGPEARKNDIAGKINWIGIGPHMVAASDPDWRGPLVTFDRFHDFGTDGPEFETKAPNLARRIYSKNVRVLLGGMTERELVEAISILELARYADPSPARRVTTRRTRPTRQCKPRRCAT